MKIEVMLVVIFSTRSVFIHAAYYTKDWLCELTDFFAFLQKFALRQLQLLICDHPTFLQENTSDDIGKYLL